MKRLMAALYVVLWWAAITAFMLGIMALMVLS